MDNRLLVKIASNQQRRWRTRLPTPFLLRVRKKDQFL